MQITTEQSFMAAIEIVTDYRLNANHNNKTLKNLEIIIVTDYRLNANHN